jgi:hypothetical protein
MKECAIKGIMQTEDGIGLCAHVIVGGKLCGLEDDKTCPHQRKEKS